MPIAKKLVEDDVVPIPAIRPQPDYRSRERLPRNRRRAGRPDAIRFSDIPEFRTAAQYAGCQEGAKVVDRMINEWGDLREPTPSPGLELARHILAMADDAYLTGHPEWEVIVEEARSLVDGRPYKAHYDGPEGAESDDDDQGRIRGIVGPDA